MIKKSNFIRIDKYYPPNKNGGRKNQYIYKCNNCPNEVKIKDRKRFKTATGLCSSCNAKNLQPKAIESIKLRSFEATFNRLIDSSIKRWIKLELTYEQFLKFIEQKQCHYCFTKIIWDERSSVYNLDRKDNKGPYSKENLVVCCGKCNKGKREIYTYEEWYGMTEYFRRKK